MLFGANDEDGGKQPAGAGFYFHTNASSEMLLVRYRFM